MTSLAATALRWAAIEALAPAGAVEYPTIAGDRYYDSRHTSIDDLDVGEDAKPHVGVFTENLDMEAKGDSAAVADLAGAIDLVFEAEVVVRDTADDSGTTEMLSISPFHALEIDLLCSQIQQVLVAGQTSSLFRSVCRRIIAKKSQPMVIPDLALRLVRTSLTLTCQMDDDCWGEAGFPEPFKAVVEGLPATSQFKPIGDQVLARLTDSLRTSPGVPLDEIRGAAKLDGSDEESAFGL